MLRCIVIGGDYSGRTHCVLLMTNVLSKLHKKVLVVDFTKMQRISSYFNLNSIEESNEVNVIERYGIDFLFKNTPLDNNDIQIFEDKIKEIQEDYDYVFIEMDKHLYASDLIINSNNVFIVQNPDKRVLEENKDIIENLPMFNSNINIIFNQMIYKNFNKNIIYDYLREKNIDNDNKVYEYEIPLNENDIIQAYVNKLDGIVSYKYYSKELKECIKEIVINIMDNTSKEEHKIIRKTLRK